MKKNEKRAINDYLHMNGQSVQKEMDMKEVLENVGQLLYSMSAVD